MKHVVCLVVAGALVGACFHGLGYRMRRNTEPTFSEQQLPSGQLLTVGVVQSVLEEERGFLRVDTTVSPRRFEPSHFIEKVWPESVRTGLLEALGALQSAGLASPLHDDVLAQLSSVRRSRGDQPSLQAPSVTLSGIGFSRDSTAAAIYYELHCGLRCGHGAILLLARRACCVWTPWNRQLLWVR